MMMATGAVVLCTTTSQSKKGHADCECSSHCSRHYSATSFKGFSLARDIIGPLSFLQIFGVVTLSLADGGQARRAYRSCAAMS